MKGLIRFFCILLACFALVGCNKQEKANNTTTAKTYTEIENGRTRPGYYYTNYITTGAADPFILEHDGIYYLYSTGGSKFTVRTSLDLCFWTAQSEPVISLSDLGWAKDKGWAPEMYEYNGKFYMIFSACSHEGIHSIEIAVCDTPNGKFKPLKPGEPFYSIEGYSLIDGSLFFDDDGRVYMYYSKDCSTNTVKGKRTSQTWGIELEPDFSGTIGEPVLISTPEQDWELKSGNPLWNEGPVVFKDNGTYYLLYSANFYQSEYYSVGYATSDEPLKFFEKPRDAKLLAGNGKTVTGPGHCNILRSPDGKEMYVVYHVHTVPPTTEHGRSLAIDRLVIREDGSLAIDGPSETRRPLPSGVNGYYHISEFTYEGSGENAEFAKKSDIANLFDGICKGGFEGIYSLGDGGSISVKLDEPAALSTVIVYPSTYEEYVPGKMDIVINDEYIIKDLKFAGSPGNPAVVSLANLPEETMVESLKFTLNTAEGLEYAALTEIVMVTVQEK